MTELRGYPVYYVVGLPRTGSTFLGDWVARRVGALNAGEVHQTLWALGQIDDQRYETQKRFHSKPDQREKTLEAAQTDDFWREIMSPGSVDPYRKLIDVASKTSGALVDTSKVDRGVPGYVAAGAAVQVLHIVRPFAAWKASMVKHQRRMAQPEIPGPRLLASFVRNNRAFKSLGKRYPYRMIRHEDLSRLDSILGELPVRSDGYSRHELFGTPDYEASFDPARAQNANGRFDGLIGQLSFGGANR